MSHPKPDAEWYKDANGNIFTTDGLYALESGVWIPRHRSRNPLTTPQNTDLPVSHISVERYAQTELGPITRANASKDPFSTAFVAAWDAVAGPKPGQKQDGNESKEAKTSQN